MKKLYFVCVLLLALSMVTCDLFEELAGGPEEAIEYDEQGRRLVPLSIYTGEAAGRSMSLTTAQVAVNYYEVVFSDLKYNAATTTLSAITTTYRAAGVKGKVLTVRLPEDHPLNGNAWNAIAFAGYWDKETGDRTLLATGTITQVNKGVNPGATSPGPGDQQQVGPGADYLIATETTSITFSLFAIETSFMDQSSASFKVGTYSPVSAATADPRDVPWATGGGNSGTSFVSGGGFNSTLLIYPVAAGTAHEKRYPYWRLPSNKGGIAYNTSTYESEADASTGVQATFTYGIASTATVPIAADVNHGDGIVVVANDAEYEFASWAVITDNADDGITAVLAHSTQFGSPIRISDTSPLANTINFHIATLAAPVHQGYCLLIPSLPVKAMKNDDTFDLWMLRNGLFDYEIHDHNNVTSGAALTKDPSLGGALLLCVGQPASVGGKAIRIIFSPINVPWKT